MTDREKLCKLMERANFKCHGTACDICDYRDEKGCFAHLALDHLIANGVVVREKGEWSRTDSRGNYDYYNAHCSECGYQIGASGWSCEWRLNFCPNCGADMRKGENDG